MTDIRWYQTLALWKSIVFMEGNYKRAVAGAPRTTRTSRRSARASSSSPSRAEDDGAAWPT